jgi:hypothetical protein
VYLLLISFLFFLTTAKDRIADGIPLPSCRHSVVEGFVCIFCLAHGCGRRIFTVSNDTSCVEVFSLFQSGFGYWQDLAFTLRSSGRIAFRQDSF